MPLAQVVGLPLTNGDGRLRASLSVKRRQSLAYSSFRCSLQKASTNAAISSTA
jgi:hypothetical protein